jgi:glutathione S-transferase
MAYTLIGSKTSPFVRRIRMLMEHIAYDFKELNIYETEDSVQLNKINPVNQIPVLVDGEQPIWDSRQIFNYINIHYKLHNMHWHDENLLTAVEGAMNSGVALLLMKRSGMNTDEPYMYVNRQKERIESVLTYMKSYMENEGLKEWNFITMTLYCFLDWAKFRNLVNLENRPECLKFLAHYAAKDIVVKTEIPKV